MHLLYMHDLVLLKLFEPKGTLRDHLLLYVQEVLFKFLSILTTLIQMGIVNILQVPSQAIYSLLLRTLFLLKYICWTEQAIYCSMSCHVHYYLQKCLRIFHESLSLSFVGAVLSNYPRFSHCQPHGRRKKERKKVG